MFGHVWVGAGHFVAVAKESPGVSKAVSPHSKTWQTFGSAP